METTYRGGFGQLAVEFYYLDVIRSSWWLDNIEEDEFSDDLNEHYLDNYGEDHNYINFEMDYDDLFDAFINEGVIEIEFVDDTSDEGYGGGEDEMATPRRTPMPDEEDDWFVTSDDEGINVDWFLIFD